MPIYTSAYGFSLTVVLSAAFFEIHIKMILRGNKRIEAILLFFGGILGGLMK